MVGSYEHSDLNKTRGSCQEGNYYGKVRDYQLFNCNVDGYYCCVVDTDCFLSAGL